MKWISLIGCLAVLSPLTSLALEKAEVARIEGLVGQLGDDRHQVREKASDALLQKVELNPAVADYLQRHADHRNPEIRLRVGQLIKDLPVTLKWIDPALEKGMKSLDMSPDRIKLTIRNRSKVVIQTFWIDWEGKRQPRRTLQPGEECTIAVTYRDHPWLIADDNGKALGIYNPGKQNAQIVYRGTEGK